jgi:hypothetical protein
MQFFAALHQYVGYLLTFRIGLAHDVEHIGRRSNTFTSSLNRC